MLFPPPLLCEAVDQHIHPACMRQIGVWDAKLWIKEIAAELFAFNDHLSCPMHVWGDLVKKVKSAEAAEREEEQRGRMR